MLGYSQLLMARDEKFNNIVAVIPLEGGFCMIKNSRSNDYLVLETNLRQFKLKFDSDIDLIDWYEKL